MMKQPSVPMVAGLLGGIVMLVTVVVLFKPAGRDAPGLARPPSPARAPAPVASSLSPAVHRVASQFICTCGACGGEPLETCQCPTAVEERGFIQQQLTSGRSEAEAAEALQARYAGRREVKKFIDDSIAARQHTAGAIVALVEERYGGRIRQGPVLLPEDSSSAAVPLRGALSHAMRQSSRNFLRTTSTRLAAVIAVVPLSLWPPVEGCGTPSTASSAPCTGSTPPSRPRVLTALSIIIEPHPLLPPLRNTLVAGGIRRPHNNSNIQIRETTDYHEETPPRPVGHCPRSHSPLGRLLPQSLPGTPRGPALSNTPRDRPQHDGPWCHAAGHDCRDREC